MVLILYNIV
ncbi:hypothetical protein SMACR_12699 [Sordaria macrospora]|uniref:Uncharacterized protein n=1 Tax=Sordaria macrospora TaxID=5147 RepID=A0A8S8ZGR9_SORMA|nr:hypothetical protein SMACR_12699 [Sordaria macrospora]